MCIRDRSYYCTFEGTKVDSIAHTCSHANKDVEGTYLLESYWLIIYGTKLIFTLIHTKVSVKVSVNTYLRSKVVSYCVTLPWYLLRKKQLATCSVRAGCPGRSVDLCSLQGRCTLARSCFACDRAKITRERHITACSCSLKPRRAIPCLKSMKKESSRMPRFVTSRH